MAYLFNSYGDWVKKLRMNVSSTTYPDSATRWTPDVADVPEGFGISAALNVPYLETLTLLQRTFGNAVIVSNQGPDFTSVNCPYLTDPGPNFQITNNARLCIIDWPWHFFPIIPTTLTLTHQAV